MTNFQQIFFSPLTLDSIVTGVMSPLIWLAGNNTRTFMTEEKYADIKFRIEGPTFIIPESRENPQFLAVYLGKISAENMLTREGQVEDIMINMAGAQVYSGVMGVHQNMELGSIIVQEISAKMDIKIEKKNSAALRHSSCVYLDQVECNITRNDIHLISSLLHNNLLKIKMDIGRKLWSSIYNINTILCNSGKLAGLLPTKIVPGENETLLRQEKLFQGKVMVERVTVNLNGPLEYDSEEEERPASPAQDTEALYAVMFHVSLAMSFCALRNII